MHVCVYVCVCVCVCICMYVQYCLSVLETLAQNKSSSGHNYGSGARSQCFILDSCEFIILAQMFFLWNNLSYNGHTFSICQFERNLKNINVSKYFQLQKTLLQVTSHQQLSTKSFRNTTPHRYDFSPSNLY